MCADFVTGRGSRVQQASLQIPGGAAESPNPSTIVSFEAGLQNESDMMEAMTSGRPEVWDIEMGLMRSSEMDEVALLPQAGPSGELATHGPGGCSNQWDSAKQIIKAGVVQGMSTAAVFGTKPIVEATALTAMGITSFAAMTPAAAMIAGVAGGVYAGVVHTLAGKVVSGVMNGLLQADTYSLRPGHNEVLAEVGTIDAPVMGAFVVGYAARGAVMQGNTSIWVDALSKTVTSTIGGIVQGMVTDAMKQAMTSVYKANEAVTVGDSKWELFVKTFEKTLKDEFATGRTIGHDLVGKTVGSVVGMLGAGQTGRLGFGPAGRGAAGMAIYLGSWFAGIHAGAELGSLASRSPAAAPAATHQPAVDIESGLPLTPAAATPGPEVNPHPEPIQTGHTDLV